jgi:hypothetical protein
MKASIRVASLNTEGLGKQEQHGKRLDDTSQMRRVNDNPPFVIGGLDLQDLYFQHIKDCKKNASLKKPIQHALLQFPIDLKPTEKNQKEFLRASVEFINSRFGGDAVFAARLDRDEAGQHCVDVFFVEKYTKVTKTRGEENWISNSKHGKELCERHRDEIERRSNGKFNTRPRAVGIALQNEFRGFLTSKYKLKMDQKKWKTSKKKDRLTPEGYKLKKLMLENASLKATHEQFKNVFKIIGEAIGPFADQLPLNIQKVLSGDFFDNQKTVKKVKPEDPSSSFRR